MELLETVHKSHLLYRDLQLFRDRTHFLFLLQTTVDETCSRTPGLCLQHLCQVKKGTGAAGGWADVRSWAWVFPAWSQAHIPAAREQQCSKWGCLALKGETVICLSSRPCYAQNFMGKPAASLLSALLRSHVHYPIRSITSWWECEAIGTCIHCSWWV